MKTQQRHVKCDFERIQVADAQSPNYFNIITRASEIETLTPEDNIDDVMKYLADRYYDYASNDCRLLEDKCKYGQYFGHRYGARCSSNIAQTGSGHPLSSDALGIGIPDNTTIQKDGRHIVTFIHIMPNAISFDDGNVIRDHLKIVPQKCKRVLKKTCSQSSKSTARYSEVFTIAQSWGEAFYHGTLEELPKIAPYLYFLKRHPEIMIHVKGRPKYLSLLGINNSRLIEAQSIHADILYMPAGSPCGRSPLFITQVLANIVATLPDHPPSTIRDTVVLIKRTKSRWFTQHDAILRMLRKHSAQVNLSVEVFGDNPLPSLNRTIDMFRRAEIVVAPHGAGESNLIFSHPDTLLIEGLCYDSDALANLCYRNMAQALGLRYYGLIYRHQCMKITANQIEEPLLEYFKLKFNYRP